MCRCACRYVYKFSRYSHTHAPFLCPTELLIITYKGEVFHEKRQHLGDRVLLSCICISKLNNC